MTVLTSSSRRTSSPWPLAAGAAVGCMAVALVGYLLWPTWHGRGDSDPDRLPITVGDALFDIPRHAVRMKVQQRSGAQERIDLAFQYPELTPPSAPAPVTAETVETTLVAANRIFVTIAAHHGEMAPTERARVIYPRYLDPFDQTVADGLIRNGFRADTPYQSEDLVGDAEGKFLARCTRDAITPGTCMSERRAGGADITFRFPRAWLSQWRDVASAIETLTHRLVKKS